MILHDTVNLDSGQSRLAHEKNQFSLTLWRSTFTFSGKWTFN